MSRLTEVENGSQEYIFPCEAQDGYLRISIDDDNIQYRYLWIEDNLIPKGFLARLKCAISMIFHQPYMRGDIVLGKETLLALREVLDKVLEQKSNTDKSDEHSSDGYSNDFIARYTAVVGAAGPRP